MGAPSVPPGRYFRMRMVGYFEGIDSERGIEWRCSDSSSLREFLRLEATDRVPDHSWLSKTRSRLPHEVHERVFGWVLALIAERGLVRGERIGVDASTLEANADLRAIVRRIADVKRDQRNRGRFLGGTVPFGYRLGEHGELIPNEEQKAISEARMMKARGASLRAIASALQSFQVPTTSCVVGCCWAETDGTAAPTNAAPSSKADIDTGKVVSRLMASPRVMNAIARS